MVILDVKNGNNGEVINMQEKKKQWEDFLRRKEQANKDKPSIEEQKQNADPIRNSQPLRQLNHVLGTIESRPNIWLDEVKKFIGSQVKVYVDVNGRELMYEGILKAINFQYLNIILKTADKKLLIKNFIHIERLRNKTGIETFIRK
jgi:hypothetical protein